MVFVLRSFVRGPLEPYAVAFADELARLGYTRWSAEQHVCFIAHLDRWLTAQRLGVGDLSAAAVERYLAERRAAGYVNYRSGKAMRPLLTYLDQLGMLPREEVELGPGPALLERYRSYLLVVRHGKFGKSRELILHPSTLAALRDYLHERDQLHPAPSSPALLTSTAGTRLLYCNVHWTFRRLVQRAGIAPRSAACRPRIHDLRHSFAVAAMFDAYAAGQDGQQRLTRLSNYLGHVDPAGTYGICQPLLSCSRSPRTAWRTQRRPGHDRATARRSSPTG
jgi:hypothetical protein